MTQWSTSYPTATTAWLICPDPHWAAVKMPPVYELQLEAYTATATGFESNAFFKDDSVDVNLL